MSKSLKSYAVKTTRHVTLHHTYLIHATSEKQALKQIEDQTYLALISSRTECQEELVEDIQAPTDKQRNAPALPESDEERN